MMMRMMQYWVAGSLLVGWPLLAVAYEEKVDQLAPEGDQPKVRILVNGQEVKPAQVHVVPLRPEGQKKPAGKAEEKGRPAPAKDQPKVRILVNGQEVKPTHIQIQRIAVPKQ
jgi:diadenosine tetraphosphate (Ap4A) HIT family hydrolase